MRAWEDGEDSPPSPVPQSTADSPLQLISPKKGIKIYPNCHTLRAILDVHSKQVTSWYDVHNLCCPPPPPPPPPSPCLHGVIPITNLKGIISNLHLPQYYSWFLQVCNIVPIVVGCDYVVEYPHS